jgi:hypothetical protein
VANANSQPASAHSFETRAIALPPALAKGVRVQTNVVALFLLSIILSIFTNLFLSNFARKSFHFDISSYRIFLPEL